MSAIAPLWLLFLVTFAVLIGFGPIAAMVVLIVGAPGALWAVWKGLS